MALLVSALFSPMFGKLIDRGYGPGLLACGALAGGICLYLVTFVTELWQFYIVWSLIGCCFAACLYEPCFSLLTRVYSKEAKQAIILVTLVAGFASAISFPAAHLIASQWGWQSVVRSFSVATVFIGAPLLLLGANLVEGEYKSPVQSVTRGGDPDKFTYLCNPKFIRLAVAFAALAIVHGATLHHLLPILSDRGMLLSISVFIASLIGPMQVLGRIVITVLQNQLSHRLILYCAFICMSSAMILLFVSHVGITFAVLFAVVFGSGYGTLSIIRPVIARDILGDENFGAKSGLLAFFYLIGAAASPFTGSLIWLVGGYDAVIIVLFGLALAGLLLIHSAIRADSN